MNLLTFTLVAALAAADYGGADLSEYFRTLTQPDNPSASCCGEADAYYADDVDTDALGNMVAIITDTRPNGPRNRVPVPVGTRIVVPPSKLRRPAIPNPTDHTLIFLSANQTVYCYEPVGGL